MNCPVRCGHRPTTIVRKSEKAFLVVKTWGVCGFCPSFPSVQHRKLAQTRFDVFSLRSLPEIHTRVRTSEEKGNACALQITSEASFWVPWPLVFGNRSILCESLYFVNKLFATFDHENELLGLCGFAKRWERKGAFTNINSIAKLRATCNCLSN